MSKVKDLTGQKFNHLTVKSRGEDYIDSKGIHIVQWWCECDCGNTELVLVPRNNLKSGHTKSCGCLKNQPSSRFIDFTGQQIGRWHVVNRVGNNQYGHTQWNCWCDCEENLPYEERNFHILGTSQLTSGRTLSCGCYAKELLSITKKDNKYKLQDHSVDNDNFWAYKVGDVVKTKLGEITITKRYYENGGVIKKSSGKYYYYTCNVCDYETSDKDIMHESNLKKGHGCPCCAGRAVTHTSKTTIANQAPWLIPFLTNKEDAYKYGIGSGKIISTTCINCGFTEGKIVSSIYHSGYHCKCCDDGYSIPEKFIMSLLEQLNIKYIPQLSKKDFIWIGKYRYDFYLPDYNMIIETHGAQHYYESFGVFGSSKSLKEIQKNDKLKKQLALENGIDKYIIIDARSSQKEWLKNEVKKSLVCFDLSHIDYKKCMEFALRTRVKEICNDYNNSDLCIVELADKYSLHSTTIRKYLKQGTELNWCNYNTKEEVFRSRKINKKCRKLKAYKDNECLGEFNSVISFTEHVFDKYHVKISPAAFASVCLGKHTHTKGFKGNYIN